MTLEDICLNGITCYTRRDLILYALGIGCCNTSDKRSNNDGDGDGDDDELRYVYEHHASFSPFPTFPLALFFRAREISNNDGGSDFGMPPFPPHMMEKMNISDFIEKNLLNRNKDRKQEKATTVETIIHLSEKLRLHHTIPNTSGTTFVKVETHLISIQPKRIGIIVVTETKYYIQSNDEMINHNGNSGGILMATSESTTLYILKTSQSSGAIPLQPMYNKTYESSLKSPTLSKQKITNWMKKNKPNFIVSQTIPKNQALIYRLSGDTNSIHVVVSGDSKSSMPLSFHRPILHGLCTLGYSVRVIMQYCNQLCEKENCKEPEFQYVLCQFVKPIFIGDEVEVFVWVYGNNDIQQGESISKRLFLLFQVRRTSDQSILVNNGLVEVKYSAALAKCKEKLNSKL